MSLPPDALDALITADINHRLTSSILIVTATILFYDYVLTFPDEVKWIWRLKKSPASYLYLINRYIAIFDTVILLLATFSAVFSTDAVCGRVAYLQGAGTIIQTCLTELMVIMRVYALWMRNGFVASILGFFWVAQLALMAYVLSFTGAVPSPPGMPFLVGCIALSKPNVLKLTVLYAVLPFIFDTIAFGLLTSAIIYSSQALTSGMRMRGLLKIMFKDGSLYFFALCTSNAAFVATFVIYNDERKVVLAPFSQTIAVVLINRMFVNIRAYYGFENDTQHASKFSGAPLWTQAERSTSDACTMSSVGPHLPAMASGSPTRISQPPVASGSSNQNMQSLAVASGSSARISYPPATGAHKMTDP